MSTLMFSRRWFPLPILATLWMAPVAIAVIKKPSIAPVRKPEAQGLQRISAISPLRFEPNVGQAGPGVRYIARGAAYLLLLTGREALMVLPSDSSISIRKDPSWVRMKLVGAARASASQSETPLPSVSHYYIGDDPKQWRTNVPNYARVKFDQVYPGIDLVYYGNQQRLEYDFVLHPGAEANQIRLAYSGADSMRVDSDGDLILNVQGKEIRQRRPMVYQEIGGKRVEVVGGYELTKRTGEVRFAIARYDRARPLIVDPVLVYATYLGGSGSEQANAIAVDSAGAAYVTGYTQGGFPTLNAEQNTFGGVEDAFVAKLSSTGALVYSTYLGGAADDFGLGIAVDSTGAAYVTGYTHGGFPTLNALQNTYGGGTADAFVTKLSPTGTLAYSTYLGGTGNDAGRGIAVDTSGAAYITGSTTGSFPTLNAEQNTYGGGTTDAFVTKLSPTGALAYSTYLGGIGNDGGTGIAVDSNGAVYVTGSTTGSFPTLNAEQNTFGGGTSGGGNLDGFVAKLGPTGALVYSTYLGGTGDEVGNGVAVDSVGAAYVTGYTTGGFPTLNAQQNTFGGNVDAFVTKLTPTGALAYSTYLGGTGNDYGDAIAVDSTGVAYVTGYTTGAFPTLNALQNTYGGGTSDAFVVKLNASGTLNYSTYLGGTGTDPGTGIATDGTGAAYVAGGTTGSFPILNAGQGTFGGSVDAFIAKLNPSPVSMVFSASPSAVQFGATPGGALVTSPQTISVQAPAGATWTASANQGFIMVSPTSGTGNGSFTISMVTSALPLSGSVSGMVTLSATGIATSPTVTVTATIGPGTNPFGAFDTPADGTTGVVGAIPVTGWALDNIEVTHVDIFREPVTGEPAGTLIFIGTAVFSADARPDVAALYPTYPFQYRAGWGYQMLTNFLPNSNGSSGTGNGTYKLHAIAFNKAGFQTDLGTKTITVDNAHATKPFGTIDTPGQGETISGTDFVNFGWALTPQPGMIPVDGSTMTVVIDGQVVGHPTYGNLRADIASLFPGYKNSNGAIGFFHINTTTLANGVHTISWNVFDDLDRGEGLGSRYFTVLNTGGSGGVAAMEDAINEPVVASQAVGVRHGLHRNRRPDPVEPDADGGYSVTMEEVGLIELHLGAASGNMLVAGEAHALPTGSTLKGGVFYWQPGPGFLGEYKMEFARPDGTKIPVRVNIVPKRFPSNSNWE